MCNEYQLILPFDDIIEAFNLSGNRLVFPGGMLNFGPMASIRIGDRAPIIQLGPEGPESGDDALGVEGAGRTTGLQLSIGRAVV